MHGFITLSDATLYDKLLYVLGLVWVEILYLLLTGTSYDSILDMCTVSKLFKSIIQATLSLAAWLSFPKIWISHGIYIEN